ncbi:hypothetical protein D3C72_1351000 [compost metagenome]
MPDNRLRENPKPSAIGRKNGPMPMRRPTVNRVRTAAAPTMFQPKYQPPDSSLSNMPLLDVTFLAARARQGLQTPQGRRGRKSAVDTGVEKDGARMGVFLPAGVDQPDATYYSRL